MSTINPNSIDTTYPIAGQDNDSQGFRDNFTNIKTNFANAKTELEDLQSKVMLTQGLAGDTSSPFVNDGRGSVILRDFKLQDISEAFVDHGTSAGQVVLSFEESPYQSLLLSADVSLSFTNFPDAGNVGQMYIEVQVSDVSHGVILDHSLYTFLGEENIAGYRLVSSSTGRISFSQTGTYVFKVVTTDGGTSFVITEETNRTKKVDFRSITSSVGSPGDKKGDFAADESYLYLCKVDYNGTTDIWTRIALPTTTW
jgi:hypothetical protein